MFHELIVSIKLALRNLRMNVGRTVLTLVGIVIGITSVIVIMSSGQGLKSYILGQIETFGTDVIQVEKKVPGTGAMSSANAIGQAQGIQVTTLKIKDAEAIRKLPNIEDLYPANFTQELATYQNANKRVLLFGTGARVPAVDPGVKVIEGVFFTDRDDESLAQVAVIGSDIRESFFGSGEALGKEIRINSQNYKIIGVLEKRGVVSVINIDEIIYLPVQTLQKKILGIDYLHSITVKVKDENLLGVTAADITDTLRRQHGTYDPDKEDFLVSSIKEVQETIGKVFSTINILLLALTSISLIVGGVGIMNVMYVAVVERTFEIGLRKAVGAKPSDILKQFLFEAIFITLAGGVAGIILGFLVTELFSLIFLRLGFALKFLITFQSLLLAAGFSMAVGIIFGYYPARKASRLTPMEALRKE
jgi:ABC-type antimicrobial peptide transport system permease subunit